MPSTRSGKNTSIVLFGERFGRWFYLFNGIIAVLCCQYFWLEHSVLAATLPILYLAFHVPAWREMVRIGSGRELVGVLEHSARNVLIFGSALSVGLILK